MTITKEKINELEEVCKPLVRWMRDNCNPHCECLVTQTIVSLKEDVCGLNLTKFEPEHYN